MKKYFIALFVLLFSGCASLPLDTLNKKIAAFEIGYGETLKTVQLWITEGRLSAEQKTTVQNAVRKVSQARQAMYIAKGVGDLNKAQNALMAANTSLQVIRELLVKNEAKPVSLYQPQIMRSPA